MELFWCTGAESVPVHCEYRLHVWAEPDLIHLWLQIFDVVSNDADETTIRRLWCSDTIFKVKEK